MGPEKCNKYRCNHVDIHVQILGMQGFGNVGSWAAEIFEEQGGKVIAVSDAFGAVYNENGLNIKELRQHIANGDLLSAFSEGFSYFTIFLSSKC